MPGAGDPAFELFKEAYRQGNDAMGRGEIREAWQGIPESCEFHPPPEFPDPAIRRGPDEIVAYMVAIREAIPDWRGEPSEFMDAGDGTYVVRLDMSGTSGGAGFPVTQELFQVFETRDGSVVRVWEFLHRDQAMRAAGLDD
jgi:ketosteroid isomerase-like protein